MDTEMQRGQVQLAAADSWVSTYETSAWYIVKHAELGWPLR